MSLRTTALIAGVIGVLLLAVGLIANAQRPPRDVTPSAAVDTGIVVVEPEMIAFAGEDRIGFSGEGDLVALTARPADAHAWLVGREATELTGQPDWESLSTADVAIEEPQPTASPSASASPSEAASPSPSPSASAGEEAEDAEPVDVLAQTSQDHWRDERRGQDRLSIVAADVPAGETLVVVSRDGSPLTSVDMSVTRDVQDGWITPLIWWGVFLTLAGIIALVLRFIDVRPAQAKGEEWIAKRQKVGEEDDPSPGTRRARRAAGEHLPETSLDEEAVTSASAGSAPSAPSSPPASSNTDPASAPSVDRDGQERP
ncbi:hypothetical protein [Demequina activiva]|uniref:Uncharacterized protein n=1 Tax=Demequina activiva TaxID=1582364 RepID=A0A919Q3C7_9MICO|nr:hypothetical protein [Demequina activiva]GIG55294.1 hypothetical protein Dac01nite_20460 [Demequina activiva]